MTSLSNRSESKLSEISLDKPQVDPLTYTVAEAATAIGISRSSIYRLLQREILRPVPGLRHKLISRRQVRDFAEGVTRRA